MDNRRQGLYFSEALPPLNLATGIFVQGKTTLPCRLDMNRNLDQQGIQPDSVLGSKHPLSVVQSCDYCHQLDLFPLRSSAHFVDLKIALHFSNIDDLSPPECSSAGASPGRIFHTGGTEQGSPSISIALKIHPRTKVSSRLVTFFGRWNSNPGVSFPKYLSTNCRRYLPIPCLKWLFTAAKIQNHL